MIKTIFLRPCTLCTVFVFLSMAGLSLADTIAFKKRGVVLTGKVLSVKKGAIIFRNSSGTLEIKKRLIKNLYVTKNYRQDIRIHKKLGTGIDEESIKRDYMAGKGEGESMEDGYSDAEYEDNADDGYSYDTNYRRLKMFAGLGIGGNLALGEFGDAVNPGINIRGLFQYNRIMYKFLGAEMECGFSYLGDREYDGGFRLIYAIPSAVYTYHMKIFDIQGKAGAGITHVSSSLKIRGESYSDSSADLTVAAGAGLMKTFNKIYIAGFDIKYYHIFETTSASIISANLIFGVKI